MEILIGVVVIFLIVAFLIVKNTRNSSDRSEGPDISDPSSAPDNIGDKGDDSDGDGDGGE
ncbi:hypothetical protein [Mesobacillus jeotgali]|uniref:hypothetical protein n=1 Tax=Mesobacillus jeotgali TaxID=129985 RepID=UPI0009A6A16E|nr:hypothetical protein [Mesobacillus jeotgali]